MLIIHKIRKAILIAGLWLTVGAMASVNAAAIYVDLQAPGAGATNSCSQVGACWQNAYTSLSLAIQAANAGDIIFVAEGTYTGPFTLKEGVRIKGGYPPPGIFSVSLPDIYRTIGRNITGYPTILTGTDAILINTNLSNQTQVEGFQIQGTANGVNINFNLTNAIEIRAVFNTCTFNGPNHGVNIDYSGNGVAAQQFIIKPTFNVCTFTGQNAGVNIETEPSNLFDTIAPQFVKCQFKNSIHAAVFEQNGGILIPYFENCRFYDNTSHVIANGGDGVYFRPNPNFNTCPANNSYDYHPTFVNSLFYNNQGIADLLIDIACKPDLSMNFINCTMWNNAPGVATGPPAFNVDLGSFLQFSTAWTNNSSAMVMRFYNNISWDNRLANNGYLMRLERGMRVELYRSLIETNSTANSDPAFDLPSPPSFNQVFGYAGSIYNQNPGFTNAVAPNANPDLRPVASSIARNAGVNSYVSTSVEKDLNGYLRILENTIDLGAYEYCPSRGNCYETADPAPGPIGPVGPRPMRTTNQVFTQDLNLKVFPNPMIEELHIQGVSLDKIVGVQLISGNGQIVKSWKNTANLNVSGISKGLYLLKIQTTKGIQTFRVVK
ncbi:hypothetical protein BKI52_25575 [marine bacterium AO1-C]|nr:hypothetical protein BKI52_25575 [marine bacterium AO1-C]